MKSKSGFTLIELLGVIIVLAIVALISMPLVLDAVSKSAKGAYEESLRNVISATDIYIASDDFAGMPDEGIEVTSDVIKMKNKRFTSGIVFTNAQGELELIDVSDGKFCGGGTIKNLVVIQSSCEDLDPSPPTLSIATNSITSSLITVAATADDLESGIQGYKFSKDDGETWTGMQTSSVYTFTGLTNGTTYPIKVKVYNDNVALVLTATKSLSATTVDIPKPTYSINPSGWTQSAVVKITYPTRHEGYVYEYSLDNASTWQELAAPATTKDITYNTNGSVIARVSDGTNIVSGTVFEVTQIDTTAPVITVDPTLVKIFVGSTYNDSGVSATDAETGDLTANIVKTGSVNTNMAGTYMLTYNLTDAAGNVATTVTRQVDVVQTTYSFSYTGNYQIFTVPISGTYKLEVWGAEGGKARRGSCDSSNAPIDPIPAGKGGYTSGTVNLNAGQSLYVYVGETGKTVTATNSWVSSWNGGGQAYYSSGGNYMAATGGGSTDIRYISGTWNNSTSLNSRIIVAGGGGGSGGCCNNQGGAGGGTTALAGSNSVCSGQSQNTSGGQPGTQSSGGSGTSGGVAGAFGTGGSSGSSSNCGSAGGGGWYGGGGGGGCNGAGGGGGSSYLLDAGSSKPGGYNPPTMYYLTSGQLLRGNQSMPNPSGGNMTGNTGNGYAKITFIP